jgi:hypothetical protein
MSYILNAQTTKEIIDIFNGRTTMYGEEANEYTTYNFDRFDILVLNKNNTITVVEDN